MNEHMNEWDTKLTKMKTKERQKKKITIEDTHNAYTRTDFVDKMD